VLAFGTASTLFSLKYQVLALDEEARRGISAPRNGSFRQATIRHCGENNSGALLRFRNAPSGELDRSLARAILRASATPIG
jgi:hypothetical protein